MIEIKGEHEDLIFKNREFIQELEKIQNMYFDTLFAELCDDGFDPRLEEDLFNFVFNEEGNEMFEECLAKYKKNI